MKVSKLTLWSVDLTSHETYYMAEGKTCATVETHVLCLETDTGLKGWGEVCPDGLGIAYMIKKDSVHFNVACLKKWHWNAAFCHLLEESLLEMKQLFVLERQQTSKL